MGYTYAQAYVNGKSFIPVYGWFVSGANSEAESVTVTIGTDGKVSNVAKAQSKIE